MGGNRATPPGVIDVGAHPLFEAVDLTRMPPGAASFRPEHVRKGTLVAGPQLPAAIVLLLGGSLHAFTLTRDGQQRLVLDVLLPGDVDGLLTLAGLTPHMCEALVDSEVVRITPPTLEALTSACPRVAMNLCRLAIGPLARREAQMSALSEHSGVRAVARQLLILGEYAGMHVDGHAVLRPRPTHQLLADMLGLRRETITLNLKLLRASGAIRFAPDHLWLDRERLHGVLEQTA